MLIVIDTGYGHVRLFANVAMMLRPHFHFPPFPSVSYGLSRLGEDADGDGEGECRHSAFLFYSPSLGTWNVGGAQAVREGGGSASLIAGTVSPATVTAPFRGGPNDGVVNDDDDDDNGVAVPHSCPGQVAEWLVSDGKAGLVVDPTIVVRSGFESGGSSIGDDGIAPRSHAGAAAAAGETVEECDFVPSGQIGGAAERFNCRRVPRVPVPLSCPPLLTALGWDRVCTHWDAEYLCRATGHKVPWVGLG